MNPRSIINKLEAIESFVDHFSIDLLVITETWCTPQHSDDFISPSGYSVVWRDRIGSTGGGICVFHRTAISVLCIDIAQRFDCIEILAIDVLCNPGRCRLLTVYSPPVYSSNTDYTLLLCECITSLSGTDYPVVLTGDFNRPGIQWSPDSNAKYTSLNDRDFVLSMTYCGLNQCIFEPTRGDNFLSLLFCSSGTLLSGVELLPPFCNSDVPPHLPISFSISVSKPRSMAVAYTDFSAADSSDCQTILNRLSTIVQANMSCGIFGSSCTLFSNYLNECRNTLPTRPRQSKPCKFLRSCAAAKLRAWRILRSHPSANNHLLYTTISQSYSDNVSFHRSQSLIAMCSRSDRSTLYNVMRARTKHQVISPPIYSSDGSLCLDDDTRAASFLQAFRIPSSDHDLPLPPLLLSDSELSSIPSHAFSVNQVASVIRRMKRSAAGPDGFPSIFYKKGGSSMHRMLTDVFIDCLIAGDVPPSWRNAIVIPIFKNKGSRSDVLAYRPISLTCVAAKIMERCILNYVLPILLSDGVISVDQYGSLPGRSPVVQLIVMLHNISLNLDKGIPVDVTYFDFARAFDNVNRRFLFARLRSTSIHPSVIRLIETLFTNRSHCVRVGSTISELSAVNTGVVQGTVLGPLLFILSLSSMPRPIRPIENYIFVDDMKWTAPVVSLAEGFFLQEWCDKLYQWSTDNYLPLSLTKCAVMHLGYSNNHFQYTIGGHDLQATSSQTDLGVQFNEALSFSPHCSNVASKAMASVWMLRRCFKGCSNEAMMFAFSTYVVPVLMYASPVWSPSSISDISTVEQPQRTFTKYLPGLSGMDYKDRLSALGVHSIEWLRLQADLLLWFRMFHNQAYLPPEVNIFRLASRREDSRSHPKTVEIPFAAHSLLFNSYVCRIARIWNALPTPIVLTNNYTTFRHSILDLDLSPFLRVFKF